MVNRTVEGTEGKTVRYVLVEVEFNPEISIIDGLRLLQGKIPNIDCRVAALGYPKVGEATWIARVIDAFTL